MYLNVSTPYFLLLHFFTIEADSDFSYQPYASLNGGSFLYQFHKQSEYVPAFNFQRIFLHTLKGCPNLFLLSPAEYLFNM
jgi:hypothetical protein